MDASFCVAVVLAFEEDNTLDGRICERSSTAILNSNEMRVSKDLANLPHAMEVIIELPCR